MRKTFAWLFALTLVASLAQAADFRGLLVDARTASTHLPYPGKLAGLPVGDMLANQDAGFGLVVDGRFLKFDAQGDQLALQLLGQAREEDHDFQLRVTGDLAGLTLRVSSLEETSRSGRSFFER